MKSLIAALVLAAFCAAASSAFAEGACCEKKDKCETPTTQPSSGAKK